MLTHSPGLFIRAFWPGQVLFYCAHLSGLEIKTKGSKLVQGHTELKAEPCEKGSLDFWPGAVMNFLCHPQKIL